MSRARDALTNIATFLLALLLAVLIWSSAVQTQDPIRTRFLEVPLQYVGLPANTTLVGGDPRTTVQIRLEGPDSVLRGVDPADFTAIADLSRVESGQPASVDIAVTSRNPAATISFITPEQVDVQLEQQVVRDVPVELDLRGSVARGHEQGTPLLEPRTIRVAGPESRVNALDFALVTVFLNSAVETLVESSQPIFYDNTGQVASVNGLDLDTGEVTVTVPVEESAGFADKLITVEWTGEPAPGYRLLSVTADPPSVLVEGRPAQVNRLTSVKTEPIDINGLTESFQQLAVLDLPDGISVDPEQTVTVRIEVEPILTTSTVNRVPEPRGLRGGYEAVVEPPQVRVVLFGPLPVLDALAEDDVRVALDLFGMEPGVYSVEPDVIVPDRGIEVRSVQPSAVTVTISAIGAAADLLPGAATPAGSASGALAAPSRSALNLPAICYPSLSGILLDGLPAICSRGQVPR